MPRSLALFLVLILASQARAAGPSPSEWAMTLGVDFCGQAVGSDPAELPQRVARIPGLALEDAGALTKLDAAFRSKLTSTLRIDGPTKLRMGSLVRGDTPNFVFMREDAQACFVLVSNAPEASKLFAERMSRVDSVWVPTQSRDSETTMWKRSGAGGDIFLMMQQAGDGSAELVAVTEQRSRVSVLTDLQRFAAATAKPCVTGALSGTRPRREEFGDFYEAAKKGSDDLVARAPFVGIGLTFTNKHGGCFAIVQNGPSFNVMEVAREMGEAFAAIGGRGTTEVSVPKTAESAAQAWHFQDAATQRSVRYTITVLGPGMALLAFAPE